MALSVWKRFEKSPGYRRAKLFVRRLLGRELRLGTELQVPTVIAGGWCFAPGGLDESSVVYSLGVGDSIAFDLHLVGAYGAEVHAFDPTPSSVEMLAGRDLPERFHFHPWAVAGSDGPVAFRPRRGRDGGVSSMYAIADADAPDPERPGGDVVALAIEVPGYTLPTVAAMLGHSQVDLLKMDIEGAEYEVLEALLDSQLRPKQILVEFHHRFRDIPLAASTRAVARLRGAGYRVFSISDVGREVSLLLDR